MYDKKVPGGMKHRVSETPVQPALLYAAEIWALGVKKTDRSRTTRAKMLMWLYRKTTKNHIRIMLSQFGLSDFSERANLVPIEGRLRTQMLKWYGHVP